MVLLAQLVICLRIQIVKVKAAFVEVRVLRQLQKKIRIRPASADKKRSLILHDRPLDIQSRIDQPDTPADAIALVVAIIHPDVHDRRQPAAIIGRFFAFVYGDVFDGIRIESGEKAQQMVGVVDDGLIQQDQVLCGRPAPDKKSAAAVPCRLHAGQ